MNAHIIGEIAAGIGVIATVAYFFLLKNGIQLLRDIRDDIRERRHER